MERSMDHKLGTVMDTDVAGRSRSIRLGWKAIPARPRTRRQASIGPAGLSVKKTVVLATLMLSLVPTSSLAQTEIQWWHAMTGVNNEVVNRLAQEFNASQSEYKVAPTFKGTYAETLDAGIAAFRAGGGAHILQVFEVGTATMMAAPGAVKPVYQLMAETGETFDPRAYLPAITGYYSTSKGEMLSFPFNSSSMVMWVNRDALKSANISEIPKTWPETFDAARKLQAAGHQSCGFSTAFITWAMLEQFSAWHNIPLATKANGLDGLDTQLKFNSPLHVRHLETLVNLQKDKTFDYSGRDFRGSGRFTSGRMPDLPEFLGLLWRRESECEVRFHGSSDAVLPGREGCAAELDHRWRVAVGDGRQEARGVQGRGQVLHVPVRHGSPGALASGDRLFADHQGRLRDNEGVWLLRQEPDPRSAFAGAQQQGADGALARSAPRQHGATA